MRVTGRSAAFPCTVKQWAGSSTSLNSVLFWALCVLALQLIGCTPSVRPPGPPLAEPHLAAAHFVTTDRAVLPTRRWLPNPQAPEAVVIAVHGFNDYSRAFDLPCAFLSRHGIACYAYDQRGFGRAPARGYWAGMQAYSDDLVQFSEAVRRRHPSVPIFILGESMGASVAIVAMTEPQPAFADGLILSAPAVWSRQTMPWYQRMILETTAHTVPWFTVTGEGLKVMASDNIEILRGLGRDPWVIKATRIDAIYGLVDLMDEAVTRIAKIRVPTLVLVGERDQIIPKDPTRRMLEQLPHSLVRIAAYSSGYHLLLRDLQAEKPWRDIVAWVTNQSQPLPSGAERLVARSGGTAGRTLE